MTTFTEERIQHAKDIVKKISLPSQPTIVIEVNKEMQEQNPDFRRIAALVSKDAAMSAKVINVINSPFFGLSRKVDSIIQALTLMGLENFRKVVLTACLHDKLGGNNESDKIFWDHSLRAAIATEAVAKSLGGVLITEAITADQAYMAGLFHDCAIPIFLKRNGDYQPFIPFALSHKLDIIEEEDKIIGSDHCVVGGMLARSWSLPDQICKAIIHHHASDLGGQKDLPVKLIALLQVGDYLAYRFDFSVGGVERAIEYEWDLEEWADCHELMLDALHLGPDDIMDMKELVFEMLAQ